MAALALRANRAQSRVTVITITLIMIFPARIMIHWQVPGTVTVTGCHNNRQAAAHPTGMTPRSTGGSSYSVPWPKPPLQRRRPPARAGAAAAAVTVTAGATGLVTVTQAEPRYLAVLGLSARASAGRRASAASL